MASAPICLVNLPFVSIKRPSLGLGTLQACLREAGLESRVEYANLEFAAECGLAEYGVVNSLPNTSQVGEWVFAGQLFPDFEPDQEAFLSRLPDPAARRQARELRERAGPFLERLARRLLERGHRLVGCTSTFAQNVASLALLRRLRELDPGVVTVMGGANCEGPMGEALLELFPFLDFVVSGEADELVAPLFRAILEQGPQAAAGEPREGVLSRWAAQPGRASVASLRELPEPDFGEYFEALERLGLRDSVSPGLPVETSRGCWWGARHHCTFCGLNGQGMSFRSKTPEQALAQFESLSRRHGVWDFPVADNILEMSYFKTLLPALARTGQPYRIFYETKANLRREQLQALAQAGVHWIQPGLESLSDELLHLMDKGTTCLQNLQTLKWAREFGVHVTWLLLFAFPGDRLEWYAEMARLFPLLTHLQPPSGLIRVGFHRFSPYFEQAERFGIRPVPEEAYGWVYPFPTATVARLAYYFVDQEGSQRSEEILNLLEEPFQRWRDRHWSQRPVLALDDDGEELLVYDTRSGSPRRSRHRGLARQLLLACESARSQATLEREFGDVAGCLDELEGLGLVLRQRGQVLGLGVHGNLPTIPNYVVPLGLARVSSRTP